MLFFLLILIKTLFTRKKIRMLKNNEGSTQTAINWSIKFFSVPFIGIKILNKISLKGMSLKLFFNHLAKKCKNTVKNIIKKFETLTKIEKEFFTTTLNLFKFKIIGSIFKPFHLILSLHFTSTSYIIHINRIHFIYLQNIFTNHVLKTEAGAISGGTK